VVSNSSIEAGELRSLTTLVRTYVSIVFAALVALVALSASLPRLATSDAWVHEVIVTVFAVVLLLRLRAARAGRADALRAVGVIAAVLAVANVVEALIPGLFPMWMRIEMVVIAALMAVVVTLVVRKRPRESEISSGASPADRARHSKATAPTLTECDEHRS